MKLKLNGEFLKRHLFAVVVFAGMGLWFGYDGYVRYPSLTPAQLYADAHKGAAPRDAAEAQKFYDGAIPRQKQFMALGLLAALLVGAHLVAVARLDFAFDETGFTWKGKRYAYADIRGIDRSQWEKKNILRLHVAEGTITLDAWHHKGVDELAKHLPAEDAQTEK